tara:strand:- start:2538 stop:2777 length:240 start_codon:yes stop_codon:yes gene_type:complete
MLVISKKQAMEILTDSLFTPVNGNSLNVAKFDSGKYEWTGKAANYVGKQVPVISGVHAVYAERRQDSNGAYAQMMCISE